MNTELQAAMLDKITRAESGAYWGDEPECLEDIGWVWADEIIESEEDKAVFASLITAGFALQTGEGKEAAVTLTDEGFSAYKKGNKS